MLKFRIVLSGGQRKALAKRLSAAQKRGHVAMVKRLLAIQAISANNNLSDVARTLQVFVEASSVDQTVPAWRRLGAAVEEIAG